MAELIEYIETDYGSLSIDAARLWLTDHVAQDDETGFLVREAFELMLPVFRLDAMRHIEKAKLRRKMDRIQKRINRL